MLYEVMYDHNVAKNEYPLYLLPAFCRWSPSTCDDTTRRGQKEVLCSSNGEIYTLSIVGTIQELSFTVEQASDTGIGGLRLGVLTLQDLVAAIDLYDKVKMYGYNDGSK